MWIINLNMKNKKTELENNVGVPTVKENIDKLDNVKFKNV